MKNKERIKPLISSSIIALSTLTNNLVIYKNAVAQPPILVAQSTIKCVQPVASWLLRKTNIGSNNSVKQAEDICNNTQGKISISCLNETFSYYLLRTNMGSTQSAAKTIEICQQEALKNSTVAQTSNSDGINVAPTPNSEVIGATFYQGENLSGKNFQASRNKAWRNLGSSWNDTISSIQIAPNCTAIVYEDTQFQGKVFVYDGKESGLIFNNLRDSVNDKISSIKVFCLDLDK